MRRRTLPYALVALGCAIVVIAFAVVAVVRATDSSVPSVAERLDVPVVMTEPGMLEAINPEVTIRAVADEGETVVLAIGRTEDVDAWIGETAHARIVGLTSWDELTVDVFPASEPTEDATDDATDGATDETADADSEATDDTGDSDTGDSGDVAETDPAASPAGSDLWIVEAVGTGEVSLDWSAEPGRWSLIAATDGVGPAPIVQLDWERETPTPWRLPLVALGVIVALAGGIMLVLDRLAVREQRRRDEEMARRELGWDVLDADEQDDEAASVVSADVPPAPAWTVMDGADPVLPDSESGGSGSPAEDTAEPAEPDDSAEVSPAEGAVPQRPSRRELREQERARSRRPRRRDRRTGETGPIPVVADAQPSTTTAETEDNSAAYWEAARAPLGSEQSSPGQASTGQAGNTDLADTSGTAAERAETEPAPAAAPGVATPEATADSTAEDAGASWRSVWGFGDLSPAVPDATPAQGEPEQHGGSETPDVDDRDADDDRPEERT